MNIDIQSHTLHFKRPAGTSRGVYHQHRVWYVILRNADNPMHIGVGECAPLPHLSREYSPLFERDLQRFARQWQEQGKWSDEVKQYPSVLMGFETAWLHYRRQSLRLWDTPFAAGEQGIRINGLIWMGSEAYMREQIAQKLDAGFRCLKLKIGAIDFEQETELLRSIRKSFSPSVLELRVDANGAFAPQEALEKLKRLSDFQIHSIEQPIAASQWLDMQRIVELSPIPVALDEELIGIYSPEQKRELLASVRPHYIILKPTLHGAFSGAAEWIAIATELGIGWWATSALESNVGLNAVAQWCSTYPNAMPQGLGTGALYTNNVQLPLFVQGEHLFCKVEDTFPQQDFFAIGKTSV